MNGATDAVAGFLAWLWEATLAGSILILLVLLAQAVVGKRVVPRWSHALWWLVILRLVLPVTVPARFSALNLVRWLPVLTDGARPPAVAPASVAPDLRAVTVSGDDAPAVATTFAGDRPAAGRARNAEVEPVTASKGPRWTAVIALGWVLGAAVCLLVPVVQSRRLAVWAAGQLPWRDARIGPLVDAARAALRLRCEVPVLLTRTHDSPAIFGWWKPRLLLPEALLERLDDRELGLVILHELVHVKRGDVLANWLVIGVRALHWFNPLVWLAVRRLQAERELVCDAAVLRRVPSAERLAYGNTLLKVAVDTSTAAPAPALVPMLRSKKRLERRIIMIAQTTPPSRWLAPASALLLAGLGCLTFTGAAEKEAAPQAPAEPAPAPAPPPGPAPGLAPPPAPELPAPPPSERPRPGDATSAKKRLKGLRDQQAEIEMRVLDTTRQLDELREKLQIREGGVQGQGTPMADTQRRLEALHVEASADHAQLAALYGAVTNMSRPELRRALPTLVPDAPLTALIEQLNLQEQRYEDMLVQLAKEHPDVKRAHKVIAQINAQIEERIDGIVAGLRVKVAAQETRLAWLEKTIKELERQGLATAVDDRRAYHEARRQLEGLKFMRERLTARLLAEEIDSRLAPPER